MIRLIVCDMDGTLLDSQKRLPRDIRPVVRALRERGVAFAVASGRPYVALRRDLAGLEDDILFICENGALVMDRGRRVMMKPVPARLLPVAASAARGLTGVYPVLSRVDAAMVEAGGSDLFMRTVSPFYPALEIVPDLAACCGREDVCKVAFFDEQDARAHAYPVLRERLGDELTVALSGENWVDMMGQGVDKGSAMRGLQREMGVSPEECMAFGDYLNDIGLLGSVAESYAMANALPEVKAAAKYLAPGNDEDGVLRVIRERFSL